MDPSLLQLGDLARYISGEDHRVLPDGIGEGVRGDVLGGVVDGVAHRVIAHLGPVGDEDVIGLAPQQKIEPLRRYRVQGCTRGLVRVADHPSALLEAVG